MIETIDELITTYFLDKEIKDTDTLYRDCTEKVFDLYNNLWKYVFGHPMPKDNVNTTKDIVIKQQATAQEQTTVQQPVANENKSNTKVNKELPRGNQNSEDEAANIKSANNNKMTEKIAHINIVQNAYANGSKVNEDDENTGSGRYSAINNVNINFGRND